ncbi:MAG TPA: hypothetical protein VI876_09590 [Dehalococcoidia bacterium]|nr:hypothetical protein [Dehalococcoidia bacterium]
MTARFRFALALLFLPASATASAGTLSLDGPLIQGGLVIGTTEPGAKASLDGNPVRVDAAGAFLIGFGRDAAARSCAAWTGVFSRTRSSRSTWRTIR